MRKRGGGEVGRWRGGEVARRGGGQMDLKKQLVPLVSIQLLVLKIASPERDKGRK